MPARELLRTDSAVVGTFTHDPAEQASAEEWWRHSCLAFTAHGSWAIRSRRGSGVVTTNVGLVGAGNAEYDCRHPDGLDDRTLIVRYRVDVDPGPRLLVPLTPALHALRRALTAQLRSPEPDRTEVDTLCMALLEQARQPAGRLSGLSARTTMVVNRVRAEADARCTDPDLDLVAEAAVLGMSRTRLTHAFRAVTGVTPHRYLVELRVSHAVRLLAETRAPVTEVCFDSGFGSMRRFHAAFRAAFGTTPTDYRDRLS